MVHRASRNVVLIAAAMALPLSTAARGESALIKRGFKAGHKHYLEASIDLKQEMSGSMGEMAFTMHQVYGVWEKVESAGDDGATLTLTFDRAAQKMDSPMMGAFEYDTDDPGYEDAAPLLQPILDPLVGESMTLKVDKDGTCTSLTGMDEIRDKVSKNAIANVFWMQMKERFNNTMALSDWGTARFQAYPNKEVSEGDTWTGRLSEDIPQVGTMVTEYEYKLDGFGSEDGRKVAHISYTGKVSRSAKEGEDAATAPKVNGTVSGKATFDFERGLVVGEVGESSTSISMAAPGSTGGEGQTFDIQFTIKSTTNMLDEPYREKQKAEAKAKAEARKAAEAEANSEPAAAGEDEASDDGDE